MSRPNRSNSSAQVEEHPNKDGELRKYLVLRLFDDDKFPFKITVSRAKLIQKHLDDLRSFVDTYGDDRLTLGKTLSR